MNSDLQNKINTGQIDINHQELFISALFKSLVYHLNSKIGLRNKKIPHFVLNTGDDIMYLEVKGQDASKEPKEISNENYIYNSIPRCILNMSDIEVLEDQVTSPYTRGNFEMQYEDNLYGMNAEFRRVPLKMSVEMKYYLDNFTDVLDVTQQIISKMLFIQTFKFDYLGQMMQASYKVPTSYQHDKNITFDGITTEMKFRTIGFSLEIETNMPVYDNRTAIWNENYIKKSISEIETKNETIISII